MPGLQATGVTESTPKEILLGAGTIYKNLKFSEDTWSGTIIGATSGGNKATYTPSLIDIEIDGVYTKVRGLTQKMGETASMEINLVQVNTDMLVMTMLAEKKETDVAGFDLIQPKANITDSDYLENISFVGFKPDNTPIIIIMENAICTSGLELEGKSDDKTVIKATFECSQTLQEAGSKVLPVKFYYPATI